FEVGKFAVALIQPAFGLVQLLSQEILSVCGYLLARPQIFFQQHRSDFTANLLSFTRVIRCIADGESGNISSTLSGPGFFDRNISTDSVDFRIRNLTFTNQSQTAHHGLQAAPA